MADHDRARGEGATDPRGVASLRRAGAARTSIVVLLGGSALCLSLAWRPTPLLLWNASASSPLGLYLVTSSADARPGEMMVARPPQWARALATGRGYLPAKVPLVKRVSAITGDRVCATGDRIFVNGSLVAFRLALDRTGRRMPWWYGCRRLEPRELFLLSARADAFDGRYFGVTSGGDLIGRAMLLWAR